MDKKGQVGLGKAQVFLVATFFIVTVGFIMVVVLSQIQSVEVLQQSGGTVINSILDELLSQVTLTQNIFSFTSATTFNQSWLDFDGVDDHVTMGDPLFNISQTGGFTLSAWVRKEGEISSDDGDVIAYYTASAGARNVIFRFNNNKTHLSIQNSTNDDCFSTHNVLIDKDVWYHIVGLWNGTNVITYLDGVRDSGGLGLCDSASYVDTNTLYFGRDRQSFYWNGSIDDVRIYNESLSQEEILALYHLGR